MTCRMTVVAGPARCGKTWRLLDEYRRITAQGAPGCTLWLSPTHRAAASIAAGVLADGLGGCFRPNILTFDQLARGVLAASTLPARPLGGLAQRQLLKRFVEQAVREGKLPTFEPIAETAGFLDLLVGFVQEMKRLEIWPEELAKACGSRPSAKDRELCHLYHEYQRALNAHHLYDAQGRFWSARELLRDGQLRPFENVRHVFVDGFTDFTRTEHDMLEILAGRVISLSISLPMDADETRPELFAKTNKTLAELRKRHGTVAVEPMPRRVSGWPALDHLEGHLFAGARRLSDRDSRGIEIAATSGVRGEIEYVARRIKKLLAHGEGGDGRPARPDEVIVVLRSPADVADLARDVFARFGVPVWVDHPLPLGRVSELRALVNWLQVDLDDWPLARLLNLLVHNCFRPRWPEWRSGQAARAAEALVRRLQIPSGRQALLAEVERLASGEGDRGHPPSASVARDARLALPLLRRIARSMDELPRRATPKEWIRPLRAAAALFIEQGAGRDECVEPLFAALDSADRLARWLRDSSAGLSRGDLADLLDDVLRGESLAEGDDEVGRVRVLSAENARNVSAPYVFIAGLAEKAFPPPQREDCLLSEADLRRLSEAGLPLSPQAERSGYEMLLFYEVATRAARRLVLSYPALDSAAQPLSPSPYLIEVERAFGACAIERHDEPDLDPVPSADEIYSPRDLRIRAVAEAVVGDATGLAELHRQKGTSAAAGNIVAALRASCSRQRGEGFGPHEGMLESAAARHALAEQFGPEHCWSPSQLEQYSLCPHQFFLQRVVKLEPIDDTLLATDYLGRGQMLHTLLAALHRGLSENESRFSPGSHTDREFTACVASLVEQVVGTMRRDSPLADGLLEIDARRLSEWLARYREQHKQYESAFGDWKEPPRPAHFEVRFGPRRRRHADDEPEDPLSSDEPLRIEYGQQVILFNGRIDRIDVGAAGEQVVFNIIDYKSGASKKATAKSILDGQTLQLPLYALAAQQLLQHKKAVPMRAAYWHVAGRGSRESIDFHSASPTGRLQATDQWRSLEAQLRKRISSLVQGVRQGQFPMHSADERCTSWCAFRTLCRVNQARALGKTWQPPVEGAK
jgi:ATP-dependent helicase/nuclease subunit B